MCPAGFIRLNLVEVGRVGLHSCLMTNHPPFRYMKPGPRFLRHFPRPVDREPRTGALSDHRAGIVDLLSVLHEPNQY